VRLSVVVSTCNRRDLLRRVLGLLGRQLAPGLDEVVVSDDGSTDGTVAMLEDWRASAGVEARCVADRHRGVGATHNRGIRAARGDLVLMLADDILPAPGFVDAHLAAHARHADERVAVVGRLVQSPELPPTAFQRYWDPFAGRGPEGRGQLGYRDFWVSNLSFKRRFLLEHGMFQEWPSAAHEDLELGYRLSRRGMRLLYEPRALGYHYHPESVESILRRSYVHGYNWHLVEQNVPEPEIRRKSQLPRPSEGLAVFARALAKESASQILLSRPAVYAVMLPVLRAAESRRWLEWAVPLFNTKVASYAFRKGVRDYRRGRGFAPPAGAPGPAPAVAAPEGLTT
jgi:GT2 family glycosyltransferase